MGTQSGSVLIKEAGASGATIMRRTGQTVIRTNGIGVVVISVDGAWAALDVSIASVAVVAGDALEAVVNKRDAG